MGLGDTAAAEATAPVSAVDSRVGTMGEDQGQHVFVSYVRDDDAEVDALCRVLDASQIPYWRDRTSLAPGDAWKSKIREAIQSGALVFLACFSDKSRARGKSTMNEELLLAIEEFRKMPPGRTWLIPVRFDDGDIPAFELGPNKMLSDLNFVDLFGDAYAAQAGALVTTIHKLMGSASPSARDTLTVVREVTDSARPAMLRSLTKEWLADTARKIQLDDLVSQEVRRILHSLNDSDQFPSNLADTSDAAVVTTLVDTAQRYWKLVEPFCYSLQVAARWGNPEQLGPWANGIKAIATKTTDIRSGSVVLSEVREVAAAITIVVAALSCASSETWENFRVLLADPVIPDPYQRLGNLPLLDSTSFFEPFKSAELAANVLSRAEMTDDSIEDSIAFYSQRRGGRYYTPFADWVHAMLRPVFEEQMLDASTYDREFDRAEIFLGVIDQDVETIRYVDHPNSEFFTRSRWFGRSTWRTANHISNPLAELNEQLDRQGTSWPPLQSGLFGNDLARAKEAIARYGSDFAQVARQR